MPEGNAEKGEEKSCPKALNMAAEGGCINDLSEF